jgi:integrase
MRRKKMPKIALNRKSVDNAISTAGHTNFFDARLSGFLLEVRQSGGKTFYIRYRDQHGRIRQCKVGSAQHLTVEEAREHARRLLARVALGEDPGEERATRRQVPTFSRFVTERYLPFAKTYKRSWQLDEALLRNHLLPRLGHLHLDEITRTDIIAIHQGRRADGAAPASANRLLTLIRYIFNLALKWELPGVAKNPTKGVPLFEENNKRERYLSQEEARRLHAALLESDNPMLRFIVPMLLMSGARKREVLDSRWEDFDESRRRWRIPMTKGGKARHVPLSEGMIRLLHAVPRIPGCPFVMPNPKTRRPFTSIYNAWQTARTAAGIPEVRIHDLRHSFASFLVNAGRSLYEVQQILGHTQVRTTQRYAHLSQETLLEAVNAATEAVGVVFAATEAVGVESATPALPPAHEGQP